jgi:hypothetical protein
MAKRILIIVFFLLTVVTWSQAQVKGYQQNIALSKDTSLVVNFIKLFKGRPNPLIDSTRLNINKFMLSIATLEGKRINSIKIDHKHFGSNLTVEKPLTENVLTRFANKLHSNTKENTIRKNLFFHENELLNPLVIAYNEKWLRDLPFIQDARIVAFPLISDTNSVDMYIVTKDIFPLGATLNIRSANAYETSINSENINDAGNAFSINHSMDTKRENKAGVGFDVTTRNIMGSFFDLNFGAKTFENNFANAANSATHIYVKGNLPLLNPLSNFTGGFEWSLSRNNLAYPNAWTSNYYDSSLNYHLEHIDTWVGYQMFRNKIKYNSNNPRHFIQYRFFNNNFLTRPKNYLTQVDKDYQNLLGHIVSYTIIQQKIIRTQYLYGFGRNEDLPSGKSLTFTSGHFIREQEKLPYVGVQLETYNMSKTEHFRYINLSAGTCYFDKDLQDIRILASIEDISKIRYLKSGYRYRQIINLSFTETLKNKYNEALLVNSIYGIPQLSRERIRGGTRISGNWESIWYNSRSFYGFRSSPFAFANLTFIRTVGEPIESGDLYSSLGAGIRVRNESLIFGTIELKGYHFPRINQQMSAWNLTLTTNLRFKYNSNIINKPDFVKIN